MLILVNPSYTGDVELYCDLYKVRYLRKENSSEWLAFEIYDNIQMFISNFSNKLNLRKKYNPKQDWLTIQDSLDDLFVVKMNYS